MAGVPLGSSLRGYIDDLSAEKAQQGRVHQLDWIGQKFSWATQVRPTIGRGRTWSMAVDMTQSRRLISGVKHDVYSDLGRPPRQRKTRMRFQVVRMSTRRDLLRAAIGGVAASFVLAALAACDGETALPVAVEPELPGTEPTNTPRVAIAAATPPPTRSPTPTETATPRRPPTPVPTPTETQTPTTAPTATSTPITVAAPTTAPTATATPITTPVPTAVTTEVAAPVVIAPEDVELIRRADLPAVRDGENWQQMVLPVSKEAVDQSDGVHLVSHHVEGVGDVTHIGLRLRLGASAVVSPLLCGFSAVRRADLNSVFDLAFTPIPHQQIGRPDPLDLVVREAAPVHVFIAKDSSGPDHPSMRAWQMPTAIPISQGLPTGVIVALAIGLGGVSRSIARLLPAGFDIVLRVEGEGGRPWPNLDPASTDGRTRWLGGKIQALPQEDLLSYQSLSI